MPLLPQPTTHNPQPVIRTFQFPRALPSALCSMLYASAPATRNSQPATICSLIFALCALLHALCAFAPPPVLTRVKACLNLRKHRASMLLSDFSDNTKTAHSDSLNIQFSIINSQFRLGRVRRFDHGTRKMGSVQGRGEASEPY